MRVLVVDDQCFTDRKAIFRSALHHHEVVMSPRFPADATMFELFDLISWDNDLGGDDEVIHHLNKMYWQFPEQFRQAFLKQQHIVHSANPVAADRIVDLFLSIGARAHCCHIANYRPFA